MGPTLKITSPRTFRFTPEKTSSPQTSGHFPKDLSLPQMVIMLPRPLFTAFVYKVGPKLVACLPSVLESSRGWSLLLTGHVAEPRPARPASFPRPAQKLTSPESGTIPGQGREPEF